MNFFCTAYIPFTLPIPSLLPALFLHTPLKTSFELHFFRDYRFAAAPIRK